MSTGCRAACNTAPSCTLAPAHDDGRIIAAQHGIEPDRTPSLDGDVADRVAVRGHKRGGIDPGRSASKENSGIGLDIFVVPWPDIAVVALTGENCNVF